MSRLTRLHRVARARLRCASVTVVTGISSYAFGIGGGAAATPNYPWVGRAQTEETSLGDHVGTGSYVRYGFVATAAHNSDTEVVQNANSRYEPAFERFQLAGGAQGFALSIWEPGYQPGALVDTDQALWYVMNAPTLASYGTLWDGTNGGGFPANNDAVHVIGFTGSALNGNPLDGTMKVTTADPGAAGTLIELGDNPNFTQGGDSGGPYIRNINGADVIVATHRSGNAGSMPPPTAGNFRSEGVRVFEPNRRGFLLGNGMGGQRVIAQMFDANSGFWGVTARWHRSSANNLTVPQADDVAILDPTTASDAASTQINIDSDTADLYGLASDVRLLVRAKTNVVGQAGVLNTGDLIADDAAGILNASYQFDNAGTLTIRTGSVVNVGAFIPPHPDVNKPYLWAMCNAGNGTVFGTVNVLGGGTLTVRASDVQSNVGIKNQTGATFRVKGDGNGNATATCDVFENKGTLLIGELGTLTSTGTSSFRTGSTVNVTGAGANNATFNAGGVEHDAGVVTIGDHGVMTAKRPGGRFPAGDAYKMAAGTTLNVNTGGKLIVTAGGNAPIGRAFNAANGANVRVQTGGNARFEGKSLVDTTLEIQGGASSGSVDVRPGAGANGELLVDTNGVIDYRFNGGPQQPTLTFEDAKLDVKGQFRGRGKATFTGLSDYDIQTVGANAPIQSNNDVTLKFDSDFGKLEAPSDDGGAVPGMLFNKFAFEHICIANQSTIDLADAHNNDVNATPEVVYTEFFGLSANSTLKLNGLILYYQTPDMDCGGVMGTVVTGNGGKIIQIPEPFGCATLVFTLAIAARRSRR